MTASIVALMLSLSIPVITSEQCLSEDRPCCRIAEAVDFDVEDDHPLSSGSCVFDNTLCSYTQGCRDDSMTNWTTRPGFAFAHQPFASFAEDKSVLVSPLLDFSMVTCLEIEYSVEGPANVDGFIEDDSGQSVERVLDRILQGSSLDRTVVTHTVSPLDPPASGRVKIRARGAGTSQRDVRLFSVSLEEGQCEHQGCDFNDGICDGWTAENSHWRTNNQVGSGGDAIIDADGHSEGEFAFVNEENTWVTLTTGYTRAPRGTFDCLTFKFILRGSGSSLRVAIELSDGLTYAVWSVNASGDDYRDWSEGKIPIRVHTAYRIIFRGLKESGGSNIVVLDSVVVSGDGPCDFLPPGSDIGATFSPPPTTTTGQGTVPSVSPNTGPGTGSTSDRPTFSTNEPGTESTTVVDQQSSSEGEQSSSARDDAPSTTVIALTVVAAVAVAGVVVAVVVLVLWRRRLADHMSKAESRQVGVVGLPEGHVPTAADATAPEQEDGASPPLNYDSVGELSPRNIYNSLQGTQPAATTPAEATTTSYCNVGGDGGTNYYNVAGHGNKTGDASYCNVGEGAAGDGGEGGGDDYDDVE